MPHRSLPCLLLFALTGFSGAAQAEWVPYEDGRAGGCYRSASGQLYGCTRDPRRLGQAVTRETPEPDVAAEDEAAARATREELEALRRELDELKRRRAEDDARLAELRAEEERIAAQKAADEAAAQAAWQAIESAKDSARLQQLKERTESCRTSLERRGYTIVGAGACRARDGAYVNCPDC